MTLRRSGCALLGCSQSVACSRAIKQADRYVFVTVHLQGCPRQGSVWERHSVMSLAVPINNSLNRFGANWAQILTPARIAAGADPRCNSLRPAGDVCAGIALTSGASQSSGARIKTVPARYRLSINCTSGVDALLPTSAISAGTTQFYMHIVFQALFSVFLVRSAV
jgi:hypothetical protein